MLLIKDNKLYKFFDRKIAKLNFREQVLHLFSNFEMTFFLSVCCYTEKNGVYF
jgi:hypothetical protein